MRKAAPVTVNTRAMHRPLEKGSCVGGGVVTASLSPPGVTLRMEDDSSEVGNGFVPFSTSEATTGGGSLFVMADMVTEWTQFPPTEYKGVQLPCEQRPQIRLTTSAQQQRGLTSLLKNCRNTENGGEMKRRNPTIWTGANVFPRTPQPRPLWGKRRWSAGMWAERANGECNRRLSAIPGGPRPLRPGNRDIFCRPRPPWDSELRRPVMDGGGMG